MIHSTSTLTSPPLTLSTWGEYEATVDRVMRQLGGLKAKNGENNHTVGETDKVALRRRKTSRLRRKVPITFQWALSVLVLRYEYLQGHLEWAGAEDCNLRGLFAPLSLVQKASPTLHVIGATGCLQASL